MAQAHTIILDLPHGLPPGRHVLRVAHGPAPVRVGARPLHQIEHTLLVALAKAGGPMLFRDLSPASGWCERTCREHAKRLARRGLIARRGRRGGVCITDAGRRSIEADQGCR